MRKLLAKGIGLDKSCNKVSLECGLDVQLGCYCGYPFTFKPNYGKWNINYDCGRVYKMSQFDDRYEYFAKRDEFLPLNSYVLLYISQDEKLNSIYYKKEIILEELLK